MLPFLLAAAVAAPVLPADVDTIPEAIAHDYCAAPLDLDPAALMAAREEADDAAERARLAVVAAGLQIAAAQPSAARCRRAFDRGARAHARARRRVERQRGPPRWDASGPEAVVAVRRAIAEQSHEDQVARLTFLARPADDSAPGPDLWFARVAYARAQAVDEASYTLISEAFAEHGWLDAARFGERTAHRAWLLVQHADDHPDFQAAVLDAMTPLLERGEVSRRDYANLFDRVALAHDRPQRYGTEPVWTCQEDGLHLAPVEDPDGLAERRAAMGLEPVEDALARMSRQVCGR